MPQEKHFYIQERKACHIGEGVRGDRVIWTSEQMTETQAKEYRELLTKTKEDDHWFVIVRDYEG